MVRPERHNEQELVSRLHNSEVAAFDLLYERYHQAIYRNCLKLIKEESASLDILQDVFVTLWEKRFELDTTQSVGGWLFVVSFNHSVSFLRKQARATQALSAMPFSEVSDENEEFEFGEQHYHLLEDAVAKLSPQKQKVFTLCKMEGKSYQEAADELHISKHTVKEYLGLAVSSVKDHIRNNPELWGTAGILLFWNSWLS